MDKTKRHDHAGFRDWLRHGFSDLPDVRRCIMLNRIEEACRHWHKKGGGKDADFEKDFNGEKKFGEIKISVSLPPSNR